MIGMITWLRFYCCDFLDWSSGGWTTAGIQDYRPIRILLRAKLNNPDGSSSHRLVHVGTRRCFRCCVSVLGDSVSRKKPLLMSGFIAKGCQPIWEPQNWLDVRVRLLTPIRLRFYYCIGFFSCLFLFVTAAFAEFAFAVCAGRARLEGFGNGRAAMLATMCHVKTTFRITTSRPIVRGVVCPFSRNP